MSLPSALRHFKELDKQWAGGNGGMRLRWALFKIAGIQKEKLFWCVCVCVHVCVPVKGAGEGYGGDKRRPTVGRPFLWPCGWINSMQGQCQKSNVSIQVNLYNKAEHDVSNTCDGDVWCRKTHLCSIVKCIIMVLEKDINKDYHHHHEN